jgi:hypothetical protein
VGFTYTDTSFFSDFFGLEVASAIAAGHRPAFLEMRAQARLTKALIRKLMMEMVKFIFMSV